MLRRWRLRLERWPRRCSSFINIGEICSGCWKMRSPNSRSARKWTRNDADRDSWSGKLGNGAVGGVVPRAKAARDRSLGRSEEHTSELQSRGHLVCRLLLEK